MHIVEFGNARRHVIGAEMAALQILPEPDDEAGVHFHALLPEIRKRARLPEPAHLPGAPNGQRERLVQQALQNGNVERFGRGAQHVGLRPLLQVGQKDGKIVEARFRVAPVEMRKRCEPMFFDRVDFLIGEADLPVRMPRSATR